VIFFVSLHGPGLEPSTDRGPLFENHSHTRHSH